MPVLFAGNRLSSEHCPISRLEAFGSPIRSVFIIMLWQAAGHITTTRNARMHA